jgi:hypothetical protein
MCGADDIELADLIKFRDQDQEQHFKYIVEKLGLNVTYSGADFQASIGNVLDNYTVCGPLFFLATARQVYSAGNHDFELLTPAFNVTVGGTTYEYIVNAITSRTDSLTYTTKPNRGGNAFTTLTSDVSLRGGDTEIRETIAFTVRISI